MIKGVVCWALSELNDDRVMKASTSSNREIDIETESYRKDFLPEGNFVISLIRAYIRSFENFGR